jgi:RNA polymerase sigma-70 factor (ECF subfamily)
MNSSQATERLTEWFRRWHGPLRKFLHGKGKFRGADLDDVAQEVFLRLMRYERAELVESPRAYLFKTASNVISEWAIRASASHPHEAVWLDALQADDRPERAVSQQIARNRVEQVINTLPLQQRQMLKLRFSGGLGYAEIALQLGTTPRSVKRALAKSYASLRQELDADLLQEYSSGSE